MATILPPSSSIARPDSGWDVTDAALVRRRTWACLLVLFLAMFALLARLYYLQIIKGTEFRAQAQRNRTAQVPLPAPRGLIVDKWGETLATTRSRHSVSIIPAMLPSRRREPEKRAKLLQTLGFLAEVSPADIEKRLDEAQRLGARLYDPVAIRDDADLVLVTRIQEHRPRLGAAILVGENLKRFYPNGPLAAHVLGYSGVVNERDLKRAKAGGEALRFDDIVGKIGLERQYDTFLRGERGAQIYEVDSQGRPTRLQGQTSDSPGATVKLTLDAKLQRAAQTALTKARNNGAIAVVDPRSGEVLALASRPDFDPNTWSLPRAKFQPVYQGIVKNPGHPLLNRAVTSRFPPGSTFKMITAAAGLESGVDPHWNVSCGGSYRLGNARFGCWKHSGHGKGVDLFDALAGSCNVFFYQMGLKLGNPEGDGPTKLADMARRFGLGSETDLDLPVDEAGLVPDPAWRARVNKKRPDLARWYPGNTLNMTIGQGDVLATPLQMALATAAIANGGTLWKPMVMKQVISRDGKVLQSGKPQGSSVGVSTKHLAMIRKGMRDVVTRGTGKSANLPQVAVAGKTGSAEDANNTLPHSWWVCFAPYDKPTIAIAVLVENSGHGSENALPIARQVLNAAFPVKPKPK